MKAKPGIVFLSLVIAQLFCGKAFAQVLYVTDRGANKVIRGIPGCSAVDDLVSVDLDSPRPTALDVANGKIYWADLGSRKIQRANLDGTGPVEDLITTGLLFPIEIALDLQLDMIYWTEAALHKIQRANQEIPPGENAANRTDIEDVVDTGLSCPHGIALSSVDDMLYWSDPCAGKIQRTSRSNPIVIEDIASVDTGFAVSVALDSEAGKVYWADNSGAKIKRAPADGSGPVEDLVTGSLSSPESIAIDPGSRKIYWVDEGTRFVQRAGLEIPLGENASNRTDIELVLSTGLVLPAGIALDPPPPILYGDMNGDGVVDGGDIQGFLEAVLGTSGRITSPVAPRERKPTAQEDSPRFSYCDSINP